MSSPHGARFSFPASRRESPRPDERPSLDMAHLEASSSRRPSASSVHTTTTTNSPASVSSSSHRPWALASDGGAHGAHPHPNPHPAQHAHPHSHAHQPHAPHGQPYYGQPTHPSALRPAGAASGGSGIGTLPRIATHAPPDNQAPRSAPNATPPSLPDSRAQSPMRSASTPDPRADASLAGSPAEYRPAFPLSQLPPGPVPPRQSSVSSPTGDVPEAKGGSHQGQRNGRGPATYCAKCGQVVRGQFVRAMQQVFHLDCFRCRDCDKVVAQKFFPVEDVSGIYPLCERDYFARLDLICAKCDQALRSSYITACGAKYHVEHFSCSVCDTVFGANDSYYEHGGKVYCHFHYSMSFANKCVGCETAILKQFVEINRNGKDECWHPECYMIHKFWNVRLASRNFATPAHTTPVGSAVSLLEMTSLSTSGTTPPITSSASSPGWSDAELSAEELKDRQARMELKVSQIWLVLSGFEESSAACIGDMLRVVNERKLLDVILLAERFILHVETLFAVIDDLEAQFALANVKGMSHAREAKQLCRKLVNFFSMLSQISPHAGQIANMQELLTQVTQLAHYLKILIRIALTGAIKLDREQNNPAAMSNALARLNLLSLDNADPTLRKRGEHEAPKVELPIDTSQEVRPAEELARVSLDTLTRTPFGFIPSTQGIAYGYRSLAFEITGETTLRGPHPDEFSPHDGCGTCNGSIEEDCIRLGMFVRWHNACVVCVVCGDHAGANAQVEHDRRGSIDEGSYESGQQEPSGSARVRRTPVRVHEFTYERPPRPYENPTTTYCASHRSVTSIEGFESVSRLEQFALLLHVALRKLYVHFRQHHAIAAAGQSEPIAKTTDNEVKRVKSVTLDRKLSSTARLPQRSLIVESPAGRMANENGQVVSARPEGVQSVQEDVEVLQQDETSVDVIRPPFARHNTNFRIVNEPTPEAEGNDSLVDEAPPELTTEDDAITLGDIPLLTTSARRERSPVDGGRLLLATLSPLQSLIVRHFALLQLMKTGIGHLIEVDDVLELLEVRKSQWWNKLFKNNAKKEQKKKGVFGVPIEILVDRTGSDSSQGFSNAQLRVPEFIEEIISTMRQMDMAIEGIFRKNGNIRRLQQVSEALDKDSTGVNLSEENPVQLAALLKRFLREMPDPLLTFRLHKLFCATMALPTPEDRKRCLHLLVTLLPRCNRDTMEVLFVFLRWVASFSYRDEETGSRMDLANLATVICPSILYAKGTNAARDESFIGIQAVQQLMEEQDDFYCVPDELRFVLDENISDLFAKDSDLPPKEIHKHCAKYLKELAKQPRIPPSRSGLPPPPVPTQRTDSRDARLSAYRSDGNLSNAADLPRPPPPGSASTGSRPASVVQGPHSYPGSQQSLIPQLPNAPSPVPGAGQSGLQTLSPQSGLQGLPGGQQQWRGPFQGSANGSRQSSRGSAPPSPSVEERHSLHLERDRSRERAWTPSGERER
ncbi:Rho-type GTPase activating protein Rga1 [Cryptotrichosporon argae]